MHSHNKLSRQYHGLLSAYYLIWWSTALLTFLSFDILYCMATSFRPMTAYSSTYVSLLFCATLFSMPAALSRKAWIQGMVLIAVALFLEANVMYARTYMITIPLECYAMAGNLADFTASVADSLRLPDFIPFIAIAAAWAGTSHLRVCRRPRVWQYAVMLGVTAGLYGYTFASRGGFYTRMNYMANQVTDMQCMAPAHTVFACMAYDAMTLNAALTDDMRLDVEQWLAEHDNAITDSAENQQTTPPVYTKGLTIC